LSEEGVRGKVTEGRGRREESSSRIEENLRRGIG
jgi:hypothetical protein